MTALWSVGCVSLFILRKITFFLSKDFVHPTPALAAGMMRNVLFLSNQKQIFSFQILPVHCLGLIL